MTDNRFAEPLITPMRVAVGLLAALLIFGFGFGADIDRWIIGIGLCLFAPAMAGGVPQSRSKTGEELDA